MVAAIPNTRHGHAGPTTLTRRQVICSAGAAIALTAGGGLLGCSSESDVDGEVMTSADIAKEAFDGHEVTGPETGLDGTGTDGELTDDASDDEASVSDGAEVPEEAGGDDGETSDDVDDETVKDEWASGGTQSMSGDYPDPFAGGQGDPCALICAATLGPCYATAPERKDISEGQPGLPMRMAFRVVNEDCAPIPGASVDVWHTSATGLYSSAEAADMCTAGDAVAQASRWFRGFGISDSDGRVDFDSCFPGWYPGRTIHIHFTVRVDGAEYVTSQLYYDDALSNDILPTQPVYKDRGERSTDNTSDGIIPKTNLSEVLFHTERMADGALLAWKTLVIRSSLSDPLCAT